MTPRQLHNTYARQLISAARYYATHNCPALAAGLLRDARRYVRLAQMARDIERVQS